MKKMLRSFLDGADGVVLVKRISGGLNEPPRPRRQGSCAAFASGRVHPSLAKEGNSAFPATVSSVYKAQPEGRSVVHT